MRLDCARHIRERADRDLFVGRVLEIADEVRVVKGLGLAADTARAESANCNAGEGTTELREVLTGEGSFPEPFTASGAVWFGGLSAFVDGYLDLSREVLMRQSFGAVTEPSDLEQEIEIGTQPLLLAIRGAVSAAIIVDVM